MASITPRMSVLLAEDYFEEQMHGEQADNDSERQDSDGRTPLDKTIDRIGMGMWPIAILSQEVSVRTGSYQWTLLALCGFGTFLPLIS